MILLRGNGQRRASFADEDGIKDGRLFYTGVSASECPGHRFVEWTTRPPDRPLTAWACGRCGLVDPTKPVPFEGDAP